MAALAAPHWSHGADDVTANHALILLLRQLFDQTSCLSLVTLRPSVVTPRSGPLVLMMRSPLPSALSSRLSLRISSSFLRGLLGRPAWFTVTVTRGASLHPRIFICSHFGRLDRSRSSLCLHWFHILVSAVLLCGWFIVRFSSSLFLIVSSWPFRLSVVVFVMTPAPFSRSPVRSFRSIG